MCKVVFVQVNDPLTIGILSAGVCCMITLYTEENKIIICTVHTEQQHDDRRKKCVCLKDVVWLRLLL